MMEERKFADLVNGIEIKDSTKARILKHCSHYKAPARAKVKAPKKLIAAACAAALVVTGSVTAFASNWFGLNDMVMSRHAAVSTEYGDSISLIGYMESDEAKACAEWNAFLDTYDSDYKILEQIGNNPTEFDEEYGMYLVYTQEMADKIDEIANKYHLKLLKSLEAYDDTEEFLKAVGKGNFIITSAGVKNEIYGGHIYNDGSFGYDGSFFETEAFDYDGGSIEAQKEISYQLSSFKKGVLNDVALTIGDVDSYETSYYTTQNGAEVMIAFGPEKTLMIPDSNDPFIVVNILAGRDGANLGDGAVTLEEVQTMADTFDFAALKK